MSRGRRERKANAIAGITTHEVRIIASLLKNDRHVDIQYPGVPLAVVHAMLKVAIGKVEEELALLNPSLFLATPFAEKGVLIARSDGRAW